ncbi:hypothetical protein EDD17DRAFT_1604922 [Pisolithus thermaeus]|nr:hypothetical protein EDD17DRAFT_1604922 [Pisolithus thermaeus]
MWDARAEHAQRMPKQEHDDEHRNDYFVKHAHLPRSIWAARVVWGRWEMDNFKVMVDVEQCPGCCDEPCGWTTTSNNCGGLGTPGLMNTVYHPYRLRLDGWEVLLGECSGQRITLGDYGDYSDGSFVRTGNIFEDTETLDIDLGDSAYCPVVHRVFNIGPRIILPVPIPNGYTVARHDTHETLLLYQPKGLSLPTNDHLVLLLKAFSMRASGKHLVITVIQCSDCRTLDDYRDQRDSETGFLCCWTADDNIEQRDTRDGEFL